MQGVPKPLRPRRRVLRFFVIPLLLLLLLGASYEAISEAVDLHRFPPPGQMVDMGGYALHLSCTGQGAPTVILEAGLGSGVDMWPFVQPEVAKATRVCSYDRSGFAWSGGTAPQNAQAIVTQLHELLRRAEVTGPYVLVGHSIGGLYSQLYATTYPAEVSGMVLVEARHQEFEERLVAAGLGSSSSASSVVVPALTRLGVVRLMGQLGLIPGIPKLPPGMLEMGMRPSSHASAAAEDRILTRTEAEVRAAHLALGERPLIVVTRDSAPSQDGRLPIWLETQQLYLSLSSKSKLVEAKGSSHMVPYDNPTVVTDAIMEVVKATRP